MEMTEAWGERWGICLMPSNILKILRLPHTYPLRALLFAFADDVIQHDSKGIIRWGICIYASDEVQQNVLEMLSEWYNRDTDRTQEERDGFEKKLLSQVKKCGIDNSTHNRLIETFPAIKHDLTLCFLTSNCDDIYPDSGDNHRDYFRVFKDRLKAEYDCGDAGSDPSLTFVVLRSFLQASALSKYAASHGLSEANLRFIYLLFHSVRCHDEDSFCRDKAALLLELLQTATLRVSQLLETEEPLRLQGGRWIGDSYYKASEWRNILGLLSEREGLCQNWNHPRLPLHTLLSRGLPGHDILLDAASDKKTDVETKCPVERMYPFQLAAIETARGRDDGVLISDKRRESLDREQLSRVYLLMRAKPSLVVESHTLDLWQDDEEECEEYVTLLEKESDEIGQGLEQTKADLEHTKAALENLKKKIANDEQRQACKRRSIENLSMRKKQRMTPPSIV